MFSSDDLLFLAAEKDLLDQGEALCRRNIWIISSDVRNTTTQDFLGKILTAMHADLDKDAMWVTHAPDTKLGLNKALKVHHPKLILVFGLSPQQVGIQADAGTYQSIGFYGCHWIFSEALAILEPDRNKKGQLWTALKSVNLG